MKFHTRILLFICLFSASAFSASAVTSSFTISPSSGCSPLVVYFTNTSTGATHYKWEFGNGAPPSYFTSPSSSYITPGTYTATLVAYDASGDSSVSTVTITVYPPPTVSFTVSDTAVCPGTPITFTSTTVGGVPGPLSYVWAFGDGDTSSAASPSHAYSSPGYYNITLTVTNSKGCVASYTMYAYIHVFTPASIGLSASAVFFCKPPAYVVFTNTTTGTPGLSYTWRFGDGSPASSLTNPVHTYTAPGTYTVTLVVTDGNGCTDSVVLPAYITVENIKARFIPVDTACVNSNVIFINTSSTHVSAQWTYGDGGTDITDNGSHTYTTPGLYTVTLIECDGSGCCDTVSHKIYIRPGPTVSFIQTPANPCPPPTPLTFTATMPPGAIVAWDYGDGFTGSGTPVTHTYTSPGVYIITMTVTDPRTGCISTITKTDTLYNMIFNISATPWEGCVPLTVHFHNTEVTNEPDTLIYHTYPWPVTTYSWTFGDGATSALDSPVHTYTTEGTFEAHLTITTSNGCTFTDSTTIWVGAPPKIKAIAIPTHLCFGLTDTFLIDSVLVGPVDSFVWNFGDHTALDIDSVFRVLHIFLYPDTAFTVMVTPYYHGCPGPPYTIPTPIRIDSPEAIASDSVYCSPTGRVLFMDGSLGDNTRIWHFGDGLSDTSKDPTHTYAVLGIYTVTLVAYNKASGCTDSISNTINLFKPIPDFTATRLDICKDDVDTLMATYTGGGSLSYYWDGGGIFYNPPYPWGLPFAGGAVAIDTFHIPGKYNMRLITTDQNGCKDTIVKPNYITVGHPVINFTAAPPIGCWPLTVTFTDKSTDVAGLTFTNYTWAYGDGATSTLTVPTATHTYTSAGTFSTTEIVTDNIGCKDTGTLSLVTVFRPHAAFTASNTYPCSGDAVTFTNASSVGVISFYWTFGDGDTSTATSPTHTYGGPGFYTVTLAVVDVHGCTDTAVYTSYIYVSAPVAAFTMSDSFAICPPLTVNFINTSTGAIGYGWTFGDGSSSSLANPSDLYITTGYYTVILTAVNMYGCTATAVGHVSIFGSTGSFSYSPLQGCSPLTVHFNALISDVPTIIWDFADGNTSAVSYSDTIDHTYTLPGWYVPKLILSDNTGCEASSLGTDTIKVDAVTPGFTTIPNPVCERETVNFTDTSKSYFSTITSWLWTFTNGDTSTLSGPQYTYDTTGTYPINLLVTDGWGCTGTITENVVVYPPAHITVSPDTLICVGDKATLTGYGGVSYTWSPTSTVSCTKCNPTLAGPTIVTTYTVTGTDNNGCINWDSVTVFLKTKTISIAHGDTQVCQGIPVPLFDSGATKYTWIPATGLSDPFIADPWATPPVSTTYVVIAQLASCIPDTNYVTVIVHPLPTVNAGPDQTLIEGSQAQLNATGTNIYKYSWGDANTLSCDSCASPIASMTVTTTYGITVFTDFGCTSSDSVTIFMHCDNSQIFIPNAFTPNGDGQNDVFYPRGIGVRDIKSFRIYNRWGQLLFERTGISINDASNAWDGSYLGGAPRPDVYVYVIDAVCETGAPINIKGDVTIIR